MIDEHYPAIKDPMNVSLKIDWNTTKNPLIPNEEFLNKRKLFHRPSSGRGRHATMHVNVS